MAQGVLLECLPTGTGPSTPRKPIERRGKIRVQGDFHPLSPCTYQNRAGKTDFCQFYPLPRGPHAHPQSPVFEYVVEVTRNSILPKSGTDLFLWCGDPRLGKQYPARPGGRAVGVLGNGHVLDKKETWRGNKKDWLVKLGYVGEVRRV